MDTDARSYDFPRIRIDRSRCSGTCPPFPFTRLQCGPMDTPRNNRPHDETQAIEQTTAWAFLALYNARFGTNFEVTEWSDSPDVRCADSAANNLKLEITMTEDRPGDIQAALGRSDHRTIQALRNHLDRVARGEEPIQFSSLADNVLDNLVTRILAKYKYDYGQRTALVVRDISGCDWDWDHVLPTVRARVERPNNPFDSGIWIVNLMNDRLFRVMCSQPCSRDEPRDNCLT